VGHPLTRVATASYLAVVKGRKKILYLERLGKTRRETEEGKEVAEREIRPARGPGGGEVCKGAKKQRGNLGEKEKNHLVPF